MTTAALRLAAYATSLAAVRRAATIKVYLAAARRFETFLADRMWTPTSCPPSTLALFVELHTKFLAASTVATTTIAVRQYLGWLTSRGVAVPALARPRLPRIQIKIPTILDDETLPRYGAAARALPEPSATVAALLPASGLRIDEMAKLTAGDIEIRERAGMDDAGRPIRVRQTWFLIRNGKGKKDRPVPLLADGMPVLERYLREIRPQLSRGRFVFPNSTGGPLSARTFEKHMARISAALGLHLTPHCLRHTYITLLSESGIDSLIIREIVGHANIATTQRYVHPSRRSLAASVARVDGGWLRGGL